MRCILSIVNKKLLFFISAFLFPLFIFAQSNHQYQRVYLSGRDAERTVDWEFKVTDGQNSGKWNTIPVPSNWELQGFGNYNYGRDYLKDDVAVGKEHGLYRHQFDVPEEWEGKVIHIVFDGAMTDTKVSINGKSAGAMHQGSFYRFKYDISSLLNYGEENLLEVDVAKHSANASVNKAERQADFWIFGGIFRPVFLEVLPAQHITRAAIDADYQGEFRSLIQLNEPVDQSSVSITIRSSDGNPVGEPLEATFSEGDTSLTISGSFNDINSWNPESPSLYTAQVELLQNGETIYEKEERFGFRTVELREKDGIYINDTKVVFKGVNRHSFWPETGRALSEKNHLMDISLMKEMNMNAVRMSHYPPDERFLELCDSLGLFVLDELTGWQDAYDTIVGPKLIRELVLRDENHPSVVIWDHGNEGGWDFANEKWFHEYDIQKRPVIYPWLLRNGVDTRHYPDYQYGINRLAYGDDIFMPTEFLHGLYDGGHGAGLEDFWKNYMQNPSAAGGFLWVFSDEAVVRTDQGGRMDGDGDNAPDGILGPYREKEGSYHTIKALWSPVQIKPLVVHSDFNGRVLVENDYLYTNLNQCSFSWKTSSVNGFSETQELDSGQINAPDIEPGLSGVLQMDVPDNFAEADLFSLTATDPFGKEIYTWTWPIKQPREIADKLLPSENASVSAEVDFTENDNYILAEVGDLSVQFDRSSGFLQKVTKAGESISLSGGPMLVGVRQEGSTVAWEKNAEGNFILEVNNESYPQKIQWKLSRSGLLRLEMSPLQVKLDSLSNVGISFNYPEEKVESVRWMGQGPYRVWKNRTKGAEMGVWQKDYNNTITGQSFDSLIYPEFKGYHGAFYWAELQTSEQPFRILTETPGLYFRLLTPAEPKYKRGGVVPPFPEGDLSFLYEIPAIGTKFKTPEKLGPSSQLGQVNFHEGDRNPPLILWFDFNE
ncbi:glycoside hydrolase family 2 TIM barrel-domain containing protein [Catalinimonas sp. 4WD22]|uniref:glycoside hydrolase family 2 protein n=1 Tax=Catalinimonas locisalis TaxID=3133978 RepID=UPI0031016F8D